MRGDRKQRRNGREPPAELRPFLDALAELLADDLEREQAAIDERRRRARSDDQNPSSDGGQQR